MILSIVLLVLAVAVGARESPLKYCAECPGKVAIPTERPDQTDAALMTYIRVVFKGMFKSKKEIGVEGCEPKLVKSDNDEAANVYAWNCNQDGDCDGVGVSDGDHCCETCLTSGHLDDRLENGQYAVNFPWLGMYQTVALGFCGAHRNCDAVCDQHYVTATFMVSSVQINWPWDFFVTLFSGQITYQSVAYPGYCRCT